jgi:hypothetical protein
MVVKIQKPVILTIILAGKIKRGNFLTRACAADSYLP